MSVPSYASWMKYTALGAFKPRSSELKAIDVLLLEHEKAKSDYGKTWNANELRIALEKWKRLPAPIGRRASATRARSSRISTSPSAVEDQPHRHGLVAGGRDGEAVAPRDTLFPRQLQHERHPERCRRLDERRYRHERRRAEARGDGFGGGWRFHER